jgi:methyl-accepting chemotaxis protein
MKNISLRWKISTGFGLVLLICLALGLLAGWNMQGISDDAARLSDQYVPEVSIAYQTQNNATNAILEMKGYLLSGEPEYLASARQHLGAMRTSLDKAQKLAGIYPGLVGLRQGAEKAGKISVQFEEVARETQKDTAQIAALRKQMDLSATKFMNNCQDLFFGLNEAMEGMLYSGSDADTLGAQQSLMVSAFQLNKLANDLRAANFEAQALRSPEVMKKALSRVDKMMKALDELESQIKDADNKNRIAATRKEADSYREAMKQILATWSRLNSIKARQNKLGAELLQTTGQTVTRGLSDARSISTSTVDTIAKLSWVQMLGLVVAVIVGVCLSILTTMSITRPINGVIAGLRQGGQEVTQAASEMSRASADLAEGSNRQAAALEETSSSMEEMSSMIKQNAENAGQANSLTTESDKIISRASGAMSELAESMQDISQASEETAGIVKSIDAIAFQTNLLALNAAVEAARAGEAGAGFAVVADEVRNLAMKAATAAKDTSQMIERTIDRVHHGTGLASNASQAFEEVAQTASKMGQLVNEIASASAEQAEGIVQLNQAMTDMDQITQNHSASSQESAALSQELANQAVLLNQHVDRLGHVINGMKSANGDSPEALREEPPQEPPLELGWQEPADQA